MCSYRRGNGNSLIFSVLPLPIYGAPMEVSGTQNSFLFASPFSSPGGRKAIVSEAQDTLNSGGQPRTGANDLVFQSLTIVGRQVPPLEAAGPLAGFRLGNVIKSVTERTETTKFPIADDIERGRRFTDLKIDRLNHLRDSLQTLNTTVNVFLNNGAFNLRVANSSRQDFVEVKAGKTSPTVKFTVVPTRKAVNSTLASNEQSTPITALGLNGNFYVNGFKITVETTDSIFELRDKINRGEDTNNNGKLDGAEDINNNKVLDTISHSASEFGPGLYFTEDRNGNGEIDLRIINTSDLLWCIRESLYFYSESSGAIEAAMILGQIGDKKCSDSMMEILIQIYDEPDRSELVDALIRAIGQIGDESKYEVLSGMGLCRSNEDAKFTALAMLRPMYEAYILRGAY